MSDPAQLVLPPELTPEQKEAARRRAYPLLMALLHVTEAKNALAKLALGVIPDGIDPEAVFNAYEDAIEKLRTDLAADRERVLNMLAFHDAPRTTWAGQEIVLRWEDRRRFKRQQERKLQRREHP